MTYTRGFTVGDNQVQVLHIYGTNTLRVKTLKSEQNDLQLAGILTHWHLGNLNEILEM